MNTNRVPEYMQRPVEVKLSHPEAMPQRAHPSDAGADLFSIEESFALLPGESRLVDTGVAIKIPLGFGGLCMPRSSHGKVKVKFANTIGLIDSDYRGTIKVFLENHGDKEYLVNRLDTRICQLVIVPVMLAKFVPFEQTWDDTARGTGGFGSTGGTGG